MPRETADRINSVLARDRVPVTIGEQRTYEPYRTLCRLSQVYTYRASLPASLAPAQSFGWVSWLPASLSGRLFLIIKWRLWSLNDAAADPGSTSAARFAARKISRSSCFAPSDASRSLLATLVRTTTRVGRTAICMPSPEASGMEKLSATQLPDSRTCTPERRISDSARDQFASSFPGSRPDCSNNR